VLDGGSGELVWKAVDGGETNTDDYVESPTSPSLR
jgi:hypothetical protein